MTIASGEMCEREFTIARGHCHGASSRVARSGHGQSQVPNGQNLVAHRHSNSSRTCQNKMYRTDHVAARNTTTQTCNIRNVSLIVCYFVGRTIENMMHVEALNGECCIQMGGGHARVVHKRQRLATNQRGTMFASSSGGGDAKIEFWKPSNRNLSQERCIGS